MGLNSDKTPKDFCVHLHMAVMHLPIKFCANSSLSNPELLTFSEIQDCGLHHLGFSSHVNSEQ